jgi:hypothetical protein
MQLRAKESAEEFGKCGCGRSPTGKCCGWHGLTEEAYRAKKDEYDLAQYREQAEKLWFSGLSEELWFSSESHTGSQPK